MSNDAIGETNRAPTTGEMEKLFVNNTNLEKLRAGLAQFNPIKTMRMQDMEIRHSAILSWLLNPHETHGFGDEFLKAFLAAAFAGTIHADGPSALEVAHADLRDADVRCEWRNIDVFITCPTNRWSFVIENKFHSKQHGDQLKRYMALVKAYHCPSSIDEDKRAKDEATYKVRGVYLSLTTDELDDDGQAKIEAAGYACIQYSSIVDLLTNLALLSQHRMQTEVRIFINHYLRVIKEAAGMSEEQNEMEKLARELYRDNRRVLDFIIEHGTSNDFATAVDSVFGTDAKFPKEVEVEGTAYIFSNQSKDAVSFLPKAWYDAFGQKPDQWAGTEGWWAGFPVIAWISLHTHKNKPDFKLNAEVGPLSDGVERLRLVEAIAKAGEGIQDIGFQAAARKETAKYSRFFKNNRESFDDVHDPHQMASTMRKLIKKMAPAFEVVTPALVSFAIANDSEKADSGAPHRPQSKH